MNRAETLNDGLACVNEFSTGWKFVRLVVPFKRNYLNRTKIWTLGSPKFRVNGAKIIVKGSRVNKVPVRFFSRTKSESLVSLIIFLVTGYPLGSISAFLPGPVFDPPRRIGGWVRAHFPEQRLVIEPSYPLNNPTSTVQWSGKGPYSLEQAGNPTEQWPRL